MFTDPDLFRYVARQREAELIEEANRRAAGQVPPSTQPRSGAG